MSRALCLTFALGCVSLLAAAPAEKETPRFATPQAAWDAYRYAWHEGRWKDVFHCATPQAQEHFVQGVVFATAYLQGTAAKDDAAKLTAILKQHGLDLNEIDSVAKADESKADRVNRLIGNAKDKEGLFVAAMIILSRVRRGTERKGSQRKIEMGELKGIKITGDRSRAQCLKQLDEGETFYVGEVRQTEIEIDVELRKIRGGWLVQKGG